MKKSPLLVLTLSSLIGAAPVMAADTAASAPTPPVPNSIVAQVGPVTITSADLKKDAGYQLSVYQSLMDLYNKQRSFIDRKTRDILYGLAAKDAKLSVAEWHKREIDDVVTPPTEAEIDGMAKLYSQQAAQQGQLVSSPEFQAQVKKQAADNLVMQRKSQREQQVMAALQKQYPITVNIPMPTAPDVKIPYNADDPVEGPKDARVTIVEFTDIQCPYCKRSQDTLKQVMDAYPKDVKLVSKAYPLPFHNRARPSAEAAFCALAQGEDKYWQFRNKAFESNPKLEDSDLSGIAKDIGLNMTKYDKCVKNHTYAARVDADIQAGQDLGVQGTPHFFVNNQVINGAQPFEAFKAAIDAELAKPKK